VPLTAVVRWLWVHFLCCSRPTFPVLKALRTTVIYHLGSIALGAFIIALIQFVRVVLEYIDKKTRTLQQQNKVAQWAMCIVRCLMWCLEKIVAFINRNAYILVAGV
jgi:choline transporter-like protein 2/4/5